MAKEDESYIRGRFGSFKYCTKDISGVYVIINDLTKEFYIGSSIDINRRLSHHFSSLKNNRHNCYRFQDNFNKHSYEVYSFYILYKGDESYIREKELELLRDNFDNSLLLNSAIDNNWVNYRNKGIVSEYKKKLSVEASMRTGSRNPFYGKFHSDDTKEKIRKAHVGKQNPNCHKPIVINGHFYESLDRASEILGVPIATISHRVKSNNQMFINWYDYESIKEIKVYDERLLFDADSKPSGLYEIDGKLYTDKSVIMNKFGVKSSTFHYRLNSKSFDNWNKII